MRKGYHVTLTDEERREDSPSLRKIYWSGRDALLGVDVAGRLHVGIPDVLRRAVRRHPELFGIV